MTRDGLNLKSRVMRVSCLICTEQFNSHRDVAATQCGHVFHQECLLNWFRQSPTCPQCRERIQHKKIIKKLFFTQNEDDDDDRAADSQLAGQLETTQERLQEKVKKLTEQEVRNAALEAENLRLAEKYRSLEGKYQQESSACRMLKKNLQVQQVMVKEGEKAKDEAASLRTQLETYAGIKKLVKDAEGEIGDMLQQYSDKRQLATWCGVLQKELSAKRLESQRLNKEVMCAKKETSVKKMMLTEKMAELHSLRDQMENIVSDLHAAERKIVALERKVMEGTSLRSSPDLTAAKRRRKMSSENSDVCVTKTLKINCSSSERPPESSCVLRPNISPPNLPAMASFLQKPSKLDKSSVVRTGYNGLGGHGKIIVPHKKATFDLFRQSRLPQGGRGKDPPLPSLSQNFF